MLTLFSTNAAFMQSRTHSKQTKFN